MGADEAYAVDAALSNQALDSGILLVSHVFDRRDL